MKRLMPWLVAAAVLVLRWTSRVRAHDDPRPRLRAAGIPYVYAILHAHHLTALLAAEKDLVVMVSRSRDGDIALPSLAVCRCTAVRGSGGGRGKGGGPAMTRMIKEVQAGRPAVLTVDGPVGPRGRVYPGIALLAEKTAAVVVPVIAIPSRRNVLRRTWDRLQVPLPTARIDLYPGEPITPGDDEPLESFCQRIGQRLADLERRYDPEESAAAHDAAAARQSSAARQSATARRRAKADRSRRRSPPPRGLGEENSIRVG